MVFECQDELLLVDAGLMFPPPELPGVELVIPDFGYLRDAAARLSAVLLTHAHEDHVGALPFLLRERSVPVYGTRLTLALVAERLEAMQIPADLREIQPVSPFPTGGSRQSHSGWRTPSRRGGLPPPDTGGTVVHTGDFRSTRRRSTGIRRTSPPGTAARRRGALPLQRLHQRRGWKGRRPGAGGGRDPGPPPAAAGAGGGEPLRLAPASSTARASLCARTGRRVVLAGRSLERSVEAAKRAGRLSVPEGLLCSAEEAEGLPPSPRLHPRHRRPGRPRAAPSTSSPRGKGCGSRGVTRCSSAPGPFPATSAR
jgi:ribonuclease J